MILFYSSQMLFADGVSFLQNKNIVQVMELAESQKKIIFILCHLDWNEPCKRLITNVIPDKELGDYFNKNFINIKVDLDKDDWGEYIKVKYNVHAYPALLWIDSDGRLIYKNVGFVDASPLLSMGNKVLNDYLQSNSSEKKIPDLSDTLQKVDYSKEKQFFTEKGGFMFYKNLPFSGEFINFDMYEGGGHFYVKGIKFLNGLREGNWKYYSEKGILLRVFSYRNGMQHGEELDYRPSGKLTEKVFYRNNSFIYGIYYDVNGKIVKKKYNKEDGDFETWRFYPNGDSIKLH